MAYDEQVAERLRSALRDRDDVVEKKMFGGIAFMVAGQMCCGVVNDTLMVRVGADGHAAALLRPHAREMDFTGKALKGFVYVAPPGFAAAADLRSWLELAVGFIATIPPK